MNWKLITKAFKNPDMRKKFAIVLGLIIIYRFLTHVPIPFSDTELIRQSIEGALEQQQLLGFIDVLTGGALASFSIMLMGLGPYINASIIMQILTKIVPSLKELQQEGESGRTKVNQYTRILSIPLSIAQSFAMIFVLRQIIQPITGIDIVETATIFDWVLMVTSLTAGSVLLMWIGELMSEQGIGNGISLVIFAGIIATLPSILNSLLPVFAPGQPYTFVADIPGISTGLGFEFTTQFNLTAIFIVVLFAIATLISTYVVVKLNEAQRVVKISYAKRIRGNRMYGGVDSVLPIKLIIAGVIPIIFAVAFLSVPSFVGTLLQNVGTPWIANLGNQLVEWFAVGGGGLIGGVPQAQGGTNAVYTVVYFLLVVVFSFFSASLYFNPKEIAENLQKQGGFIAGIRPGPKTEKYLRQIVNRLTGFGSVALGLIAVLPFIAERITGTQQLTIGGTGLLIVVAVAIQSLRQIESKALMVTYDNE